MRVLHVHRIGGIGGSERHLLTLLPALAERGADVRFLGLDDWSRAPDPFYEQLEVPYERIRAPRDVDPVLAARTWRAIRRARPDVVHTHLVHADLYGAFGQGRLVATKHNDDPFRTGPYRFVERGLARRAARIVAITDALARFQVERVGLPARKVVTIHYGLDAPPDAWGTNPADDVPPDARVVLAVCRLEHQKGLDVAVRALASLDDPRAVLLIVGGPSGPDGTTEVARLHQLVDDLDLTARVRFVEPQSHHLLSTYYRAADVCLVPSRSESFGLVALEAAACGTPVVAAAVGGLRGLVEHGRTGFLVEGRDPEAFAAYAGELIDNLRLARQLGDAAAARARRYTWSTTAARLRRLYTDLSARRLVECP